MNKKLSKENNLKMPSFKTKNKIGKVERRKSSYEDNIIRTKCSKVANKRTSLRKSI